MRLLLFPFHRLLPPPRPPPDNSASRNFLLPFLLFPVYPALFLPSPSVSSSCLTLVPPFSFSNHPRPRRPLPLTSAPSLCLSRTLFSPDGIMFRWFAVNEARTDPAQTKGACKLKKIPLPLPPPPSPSFFFRRCMENSDNRLSFVLFKCISSFFYNRTHTHSAKRKSHVSFSNFTLARTATRNLSLAIR